MPSNARVESFFPFDALFPLADVVVTNGGYGGVQLALHHGVPLVVAGGSEDKPAVAARVAGFGVGVDLRTGRPGTAAVGQAVRRVLDEPAFRRRAQGPECGVPVRRPSACRSRHHRRRVTSRAGSGGAVCGPRRPAVGGRGGEGGDVVGEVGIGQGQVDGVVDAGDGRR
ncbi:glycosyltransferase [Streptomyces griseoaurantiacus]|uniref:glycosyltransferase n=1 Tax=Streptomyces griseoaurantiacus TaxID=68213 RepID=UPI0038701C02